MFLAKEQGRSGFRFHTAAPAAQDGECDAAADERSSCSRAG
jgi:hypothetical protein